MQGNQVNNGNASQIKPERKVETMEEKCARWEKQAKMAKKFAINSGLDLKKIARERTTNELAKRRNHEFYV